MNEATNSVAYRKASTVGLSAAFESRSAPVRTSRRSRKWARRVHDEYYGDVTVEGMTDTPIPWPGFHCSPWPAQGADADPLRRPRPRRGRGRRSGRVTLLGHESVHGQSSGSGPLAGCEDSNAVFAALAIKRADPAFRKKYGYPVAPAGV